MQAIVLRQKGPAENLRLEEIPPPEPRPHEVLVRLRAAALNHRDIWIRSGRGAYAGEIAPVILGSDGAGEVVSVGAEADPALMGQAVVINPSLHWGPDDAAQGADFQILGFPDDGTYAQYITVPASNIFPKPAVLSFEAAAALPLAALTAYRAVVTRARVQAGETVLITGIGGGVAVYALQIARHLGARVLITSGSDVKLASGRELGAEDGANYRTQDWSKAILAMTAGKGPDVIIDSVGGTTFLQALDLLRSGGRIVSYGATLGPLKEVEMRRIFWRQLTVLGSTMGSPREFAAMLELFGSHLRPVVDRVFPLAEAAAAHRHMEGAEQFGKIVLGIS